MNCYCIVKPTEQKFLSIDENWVDFETGIRDDSIRGYTSEEMETLNKDATKHGGEVRQHPAPSGVTLPLFYDWGT
jgi:hypothetical protein